MNIQIIKGNLWTARQIENSYMVSLKDGASIVSALLDFVMTLKIRNGQVSGLGFINEAVLYFLDPYSKKNIEGKLEDHIAVPNITGAISESEGNPVLHLNATLTTKQYTALTGDLADAKVDGKFEFFVYPFGTKTTLFKNNFPVNN